MPVIPVADPADPRLRDYLGVRERQLAVEFSPPGPGVAETGDPLAPWGKFMAEGDVVLAHLVRSPFRTISVLCTPTRYESAREAMARLDADVPVYIAPPSLIDQTIGFHLHRGLMAIGARRAPMKTTDILARTGPVVILESLTNHDNVGSVFRNAAAFGAAGVLLSPGCADPLYRKSIRVSVGHALRVPFATLEPWPNAMEGLSRTVLALSPRAEAVALRAITDEPSSLAVLFGTEGPGLSDPAMALANRLVKIPMAEGVDSLNVGVTSALVLEHLAWCASRIP